MLPDHMVATERAARRSCPRSPFPDLSGFCGLQESGSLFVTRQQLTSITTLVVPTENNIEVQRFWTQLEGLLTCTGPSTAETGLGDRSAVSINLMGGPLDMTKRGAELEILLANVLQCKVGSVIPESAAGRLTLETYFNWDLFMAATDRMKHEMKTEQLGYDDSEGD